MARVCFHKYPDGISYPDRPPFDPPEIFPELSKVVRSESHTDAANRIYASVRDILAGLGLDQKNQRASSWNPLGELVKEGQTVLLKPNLVTHQHLHGDRGVFWIISHPSILRVLIDYALLAVGPDGRVIIGDAPLENCDFTRLCAVSGLQSMVDSLRQRGHGNIELLDFRTFCTTQYPDSQIIKADLPGDPRGYTDIDLGNLSFFHELEDEQGEQNYYTLGDHSVDHLDPMSRKPGMPNGYHSAGRHVYRIPNTVLDAKLIVNIAKLKTHKFSGVTLCLKNAIGTCPGKEFLPHRRPGTPMDGGDSFPQVPSAAYVRKLRLRRRLFSLLGGKNVAVVRSWVRRVIPAKLPHEIYAEPLYGDWFGNDTIWRTTLDLNLILCHATRAGMDWTCSQRTFLGFIDGIVGMDHEAPMCGLPVDSRLLIAARDPVAADLVASYLMGFDPRKVPTLMAAMSPRCRCLGNGALSCEAIVGNHPLAESRCKFVPPRGWMGRLESPELDWPFC